MTSPQHKKLLLSFFGTLLAVSLFFFFYNLSRNAFWDYDEAIYANVIHDSEVSGDFITPGGPEHSYFEKPPLYFWEAIISHKLFSNVEFAYRFPAALAGLLSVIIVILVAYELSESAATSLIAATIMATSAPYIEAARQVRLDVPVAMWMLLAFLFFLKGKKAWWWYPLFGFALASAFMTKSVIALFIVPVIFVYSFATKDFTWLKNVYFWSSVVVFFIVLLPWHLYETMKHGAAFWHTYLVNYVFNRVQGDVIGGSTTAWGYIKFFFTYGEPWSALSAMALGLFVLPLKTKLGSKDARGLIYGAFTLLLIFLLVRTKILYYLTPLFPFLAIGLGLLAKNIYDAIPQKSNLKLVSVLVGVVALVGAGAHTATLAFHGYAPFAQNDLISNDERQVGLTLSKQADILPVKAYIYDYWDTIRFYSGGKTIETIDLGTPLNQPFFFIVPTPFLKSNSFGENIVRHLTELYQGPAATLYRFNP